MGLRRRGECGVCMCVRVGVSEWQCVCECVPATESLLACLRLAIFISASNRKHRVCLPKVTTLPSHAPPLTAFHSALRKVFVAAAALMKMSSKFLLSDGN